MDIRPEPLRVVHRLIGPQEIQDPQKRFLPDIVNQLPGPQTVPQRHPDRIAEMNNKMPLRCGVALAKPDQILIVERRFVQELRILQRAIGASNRGWGSRGTLGIASHAALPF
jgi:hypothetical protein